MGLFWGVGSFLNQKFTLQIVDMYIRTVFVPKWGRGGKGQIHPFWHGKASLGEISPLMWGDLPSLFPVERGGAGRGANGKLGGAGRAEQSWLFGEDSGWRGGAPPPWPISRPSPCPSRCRTSLKEWSHNCQRSSSLFDHLATIFISIINVISIFVTLWKYDFKSIMKWGQGALTEIENEFIQFLTWFAGYSINEEYFVLDLQDSHFMIWFERYSINLLTCLHCAFSYTFSPLCIFKNVSKTT